MAYDIPSISDLEAIQLLNKHYAEVVTSKEGGVSSAADITQTTNPITGVTRRTLYKILDDAQAEHDAQISAHEVEHDNQIAAHEIEHDAQITAHEVEHDNQMQSFENDFDGRLAGMAFTRVGTFTAGATLTDMRQTLLWEVSQGGDGHEYGWAGTFPKVVAPGATPAASGGIGAGTWVDRTDVTLRTEITASITESMRRSYAEVGYNLVAGSFEAGGTLVNTNDVLLHEASGKAFSGPAGTVAAGTNPASGGFVDKSEGLLRHELATSNGATKVGTSDGGSVQDFIDAQYTTVAELATGKFQVGTYVRLTDRAIGLFLLQSGGVADGKGILDAGNGNTAVITESIIIMDYFGVDKTGVTPIDDVLLAACDYVKQGEVRFGKGVYTVDDEINITLPIKIIADSGAKFNYTSTPTKLTAFKFTGSEIGTDLLTVDGQKGSLSVTIADTSAYNVGSTVQITATDLAYTGGRVQDTKRQMLKIRSKTGTTLTFFEQLLFDYSVINSAKLHRINFLSDVGFIGGELKDTGGQLSVGVYFDKCSKPVLSKTVIENFYESDCRLENCLDIDVSGNTLKSDLFTSLQYGVAVYGCYGGNVDKNNLQCLRTGIDITELSQGISATENYGFGSINTHTAHYNTITNNNIFGSIILRGPYNSVKDNIATSLNNVSAFDMDEAAIVGGNTVEGNEFSGYINARIFANETKINNNKFIFTGDYPSNPSGIRVQSAGATFFFDFKENKLIAKSSTHPVTGLDFLQLSGVISNSSILNNDIIGFDGGIRLSAYNSFAESKNVIVKGNKIMTLVNGIKFRFIDNLTINENIIDAYSGRLISGIEKEYYDTTVRTTMSISGNIISKATTGIQAGTSTGTGTVTNTKVLNNIYNDVTTPENVTRLS